jgi:hypothetical protein
MAGPTRLGLVVPAPAAMKGEPKLMRWLGRLSVVLIIILIAYVAWPLIGLKQIADAIAARDATQFIERLDVNELKRSIAAQIVRGHMKLTHSESKLSPFARNMAVQAGMMLADSFVVEIVKSDRLFDLLTLARVNTFAAPSIKPQGWGLPNLRNASKFLNAAQYQGRNFYLATPVGAQPADRFRLRLKLSEWKWKLAGVDLPEQMQLELAREFGRTIAP